MKDIELRASGVVDDVHWHFFQGADDSVLSFLKQQNISLNSKNKK